MKSFETSIGRVIVGRIMPDEDIIGSITEIVKDYKIKAGLVNVIGALKKFTIGFFDISTKEYSFKTFEEDVELVACMGNISWKEGEPIVHLHITLGREDLSLMGGHLSQPSIVSVTGEVYIYEIADELNRAEDSLTGLSLLDLK